jgi:hypothetical protein
VANSALKLTAAARTVPLKRRIRSAAAAAYGKRYPPMGNTRVMRVAVLVLSASLAGCSTHLAAETSGIHGDYVIRPKSRDCPNCEFYDSPQARGEIQEYAPKCCPTPTESEVRAAIPVLEEHDLSVPACGEVGPGNHGGALYFDYIGVSGSHEVRLKHVGCQCGCDKLVCQYEVERRYYDVDPRRNFVLDAGVSLETALALVRLLEHGRIRFGDYEDEWRELLQHSGEFVVSRVEARGATFVLSSGGCGCTQRVVATIEGTGDAAFIRLTEAPSWGCV